MRSIKVILLSTLWFIISSFTVGGYVNGDTPYSLEALEQMTQTPNSDQPILDSTQRGSGVALVLSGGGAKGLYHVGVIKALEENQIPIDYVSGASMGAIVGALYASGWSPQRMWDFFLTDSVSVWLSGRIPDEYQGYYRKFEPTPAMIEIDIVSDSSLNKNILKMPTNLIPPYMLDLAFMKLLAPPSTASRSNFDSLMVPFRCVASDVFNNELVTFSQGSLPYSVRASMTIPLVFQPLQKDSILLYDGGVMNNFPWQAALENFKPENIIGGVCTDNFENPSLNNILGQVMVMVTRPTDYSLPDTTRDVVVARVMPQIAVLDYSKAAEVMQFGYDDTMERIEEIKQKIKGRVTQEEVDRKRQDFLSKVPEFIFDSVEIIGLTPAQTRYVRRQLGLHLQDRFNYEYFYEKYLKIISAEVFVGGFPEFLYNPLTGYYMLRLTMETKEDIGFALGGNISSTSLNQGYASFSYKHTSSVSSTYGIEGNFGMFENGVKVGGRHDFYTNFPFYVDYKLDLSDYNYNGANMEAYYKNKDWRFENQTNFKFTTSTSIPILKNSAFRAKLAVGSNQYNYYETLYTSADNSSQSRFQYYSLNLEVETSSINFPLYATSGEDQLFAIRFVDGRESYIPGSNVLSYREDGLNRWWLEFQFKRESYIEMGRWFNLGYHFSATVSNAPEFNNFLMTEIMLPRFHPVVPMYSMFMTEFSSPSYVGVGLMPIFDFLDNDKFYLRAYAFAFLPQELVYEGDVWYAPTFSRLESFTEFIFGASLVYQTPIGPASLNLTKYSTGNKNWNLQFNFGYTLFKNIR